MMYLTGGLAIAEIKTAGTILGFSPGSDDNGNPPQVDDAAGHERTHAAQ
jgi:hypothetical protein